MIHLPVNEVRQSGLQEETTTGELVFLSPLRPLISHCFTSTRDDTANVFHSSILFSFDLIFLLARWTGQILSVSREKVTKHEELDTLGHLK